MKLRKWWIGSLMLLLVFSLVGCGGSSGPSYNKADISFYLVGMENPIAPETGYMFAAFMSNKDQPITDAKFSVNGEELQYFSENQEYILPSSLNLNPGDNVTFSITHAAVGTVSQVMEVPPTITSLTTTGDSTVDITNWLSGNSDDLTFVVTPSNNNFMLFFKANTIPFYSLAKMYTSPVGQITLGSSDRENVKAIIEGGTISSFSISVSGCYTKEFTDFSNSGFALVGASSPSINYSITTGSSNISTQNIKNGQLILPNGSILRY